jgi:Mlc titration factor MtfA (ptsG expression regulator)
MFGFMKQQRWRKITATPFPAHQRAVILRNVAHHTALPKELQARHEERLRIFFHEKTWVGCKGLNVTDEMKLTVSALAALVTLGFEKDWDFARVKSILLYPSSFRSPNPEDDYEDDDLGEHIADGQAWYRGPVILNWLQVIEEARQPDLGYNVVVHEFTHQLDFLDGSTDGIPPLASKEMMESWVKVMSAALERHRRQNAFFSDQASDSPTEFFSDAAEAFFCRPVDLNEYEPGVFTLLNSYFQLDPREWLA